MQDMINYRLSEATYLRFSGSILQQMKLKNNYTP